MSRDNDPATLSAGNLDRRIRSILGHLAAEKGGGEAVAALRALERLLPAHTTLADVIFVGLHHLRQDLADPSLAREVRLLGQRMDEAQKREEHASRRVVRLEQALAGAIEAMERAIAAIDEEREALGSARQISGRQPSRGASRSE